MNQLQISEMNKQISYNDGKIFWNENKGYTNKTMQYLSQCGYYAATSGAMYYLFDSEGNKIVTAYSWVGLLLETAKIMA